MIPFRIYSILILTAVYYTVIFSADKDINMSNTVGFRRLVLFVIDAFRADFLFENKFNSMPFVNDLIQRRLAVKYVAKVQTPTVTMPRIKVAFYRILSSTLSDLYNFCIL